VNASQSIDAKEGRNDQIGVGSICW